MSTEPPTYDFMAYLSKLTHNDHWDIQILSGGYANHTVRASRGSARRATDRVCDSGMAAHEIDDRSVCIWMEHASIVLKQAPPYFAKFPDMVFSQSRQVSSCIL